MSSGEFRLERVRERANHENKAHRDHDRRRDLAHPRDRADLDAEGGERSTDDGEGQRKARRKRKGPTRVVCAACCDHDRRQRQDARAKNCQPAGCERERRGEDRIHIAAFSTLTTDACVTPHDMRETCLPPL